MQELYQKADSRNLPRIDVEMVFDFLSNDVNSDQALIGNAIPTINTVRAIEDRQIVAGAGKVKLGMFYIAFFLIAQFPASVTFLGWQERPIQFDCFRFFHWDYLKSKVYQRRPQRLQELRLQFRKK